MATTNRHVLQLAGSSYTNIAALSGSEAVQARELLISTDTKQLIMGTGAGSYVALGTILTGDTSAKTAATPTLGVFFWDTQAEGLFVGTGSEWKPATSADLSNYVEKVDVATDSSIVGNLTKIASDGSYEDSGVKVNDSGSAATDLWSADKVIKYVSGAVNGLAWQAPVKSATNVVPAGPSKGDRYLVTATATGAWAGNEDKIAEFDGTDWQFVDPVDGMAVFAEDDDAQRSYNGSAWVTVSDALKYTAGDGISFGANNKTVAVSVKDKAGLKVTSADGVEVLVDGTSIVFDDSTGELMVDSLDFGEF